MAQTLPGSMHDGLFGDRIQELRLEQELSTTELAQLAKTSIGVIVSYERGEILRPKMDTVRRVARVLRTTVAWLFFGRGERHDAGLDTDD